MSYNQLVFIVDIHSNQVWGISLVPSLVSKIPTGILENFAAICSTDKIPTGKVEKIPKGADTTFFDIHQLLPLKG